ncbi:MAG: hypothetical protein UY50_C0027G0024 [Parcubacteria group bacterium GW2011_GWA2_49_9]|nr:MAG: hypothetical protein UY50_C0027G0024 [Parcubacteria group bacterium GW2011_GWA2_49_9]
METAEVRSQYTASQVLDASVDGIGRLQFILDLGQSGALHNKLHIDTGSLNYKRQVSVYAAPSLLSHGSSGWSLLTDKGYIFKFTDPQTTFSTDSGEVAYPQSSSRYLRVVVESGPEGALSLVSGSVYRYEISSAKEETETLPADVLQEKETQTTEVIVDLGAGNIPTHRLTLSLEEEGNFSRTAYLFGSADAKTWTRIGQGHLSQINTQRFTGGNSAIEYPESTYRFYKVSIQNFDDVPLTVANHVEVTHIIRTVVFEATPQKAYTLYYGNPKAFTPRYDLSRYFEYLETTSLPEATLGSERENSEYIVPAGSVVPFTERNKLLLNVTLAFLCLLIAMFVGWYIWRHVRHNASAGIVPPVMPSVLPQTPTSASAPQSTTTPQPAITSSPQPIPPPVVPPQHTEVPRQ